MKTRIIYLEITSWVGTSAIGATHTYGRLVWKRKTETGFRYRNEYELRRPMTSKEIKAENSEMVANGFSPSWKKGDTTRGFFNEADVIRAGTETAARLFSRDSYLLIKGEYGCCSAMPILDWPKHFEQEGKRMNELGQEWEKIGGYGRTFSKPDPARDKRAEELDKEWQQLLDKITKQ